jgi:hypothetical protein
LPVNLVPTKFSEVSEHRDLDIQLEPVLNNPLGLATRGYYDVGADGVAEISYNPSIFLDTMNPRHIVRVPIASQGYDQIVEQCRLGEFIN